ncbi:MAG TPA: hypothetical protein VIJ15_10295, partial [Dermatophilaceae bacterium]
QYSFFAFVDTRLVPYPPLEIDPNTERKLSVGTAPKQWSGKVTYTIASNVSIPNSGSGPDGSSFSETTTITETGGGSYDLVPGSQAGTLKYASPMGDYHFRRTFNRTDVSYVQTSDGPCTINGTTADEDTLDGTTDVSQQFAVFQLYGDSTRYSLTIGTLDGAAIGTARRSSRTQVSGPAGLCPLPVNQNSTNPTSGGFPGHGFLIDRPLDPAHLDLIEGSEVYNETVGGNLLKTPSVVAVVLFFGVVSSAAEPAADRNLGIPLYPGASEAGVEGAEKTIKASGYATGVCRRTRDSLAKVVAFYKKQPGLALVGEPTEDNAAFSGPAAGSSLSLNSPWMDVKTLQMQKDTLICIAGRDPR